MVSLTDIYKIKESIIIEDLIKQKDIVVATGGGIILKNKNIQLMMENGIVIYLKMSVETQIERIESLEEKSLKKDFYRPLEIVVKSLWKAEIYFMKIMILLLIQIINLLKKFVRI